MKKLTKFVAWLYIIPQIPGMFFCAALGAVLILAGLGVIKTSDTPHWLAQITVLIGIPILFIGLAIMVLDIIPWIYLLKKRVWAWWMLTIIYGLGTLGAVAPLLHPLISWAAVKNNLGALIYFVPTFWVLIADPPAAWRSRKQKRKHGTVRHRRRTNTNAKRKR